MLEVYLLVLLPSLAVVFFAVKGLTPAGIEWRGRKLPVSASTAISVITLIAICATNVGMLWFLFARH